MQKRLILIGLLFIGLAGCATKPPGTTSLPSAAETEAPVWGNRVGVLSNIQDWDLNALIAIRANASHAATSANMNWKQSKKNYDILLFGPLGTGAVKLAGQPGYVALETADGKKFNAATPEALLLQQSGWNLPVSNLFYWIRGLPVPKIPAQKSFDSYHRLSELSQQGWTIQYLRYKNIGAIDVPDKMILANSDVNVKIIIKNWQF
ncbi:MAG: outer membrane lipoprotein LolB [Gammaproteobacteria bacterium]|nr:outer membrane lipoprotein LolB [Gammaproteobacteria bacterium]